MQVEPSSGSASPESREEQELRKQMLEAYQNSTSIDKTSEHTDDFWERLDKVWIRHHYQERTTFFMPDRMSSGGPRLETLHPLRLTICQPVNPADNRYTPETWES